MISRTLVNELNVLGSVISIIDESTILRLSLARKLRQIGYTVYEFATIDEWLSITTVIENTNLLILDVKDIGSDAIIHLQMIRRNTMTKAIPILFLSNESHVQHVKEIIQLGISDFVLKPVQQDDLIARVQSLLPLATIMLPVDDLLEMELVKARRGNHYPLSLLLFFLEERRPGQRFIIAEQFQRDCKLHLRITDIPFITGDYMGLLLPFTAKKFVPTVMNKVTAFMNKSYYLYFLPIRWMSVSYPDDLQSASELFNLIHSRSQQATPIELQTFKS